MDIVIDSYSITRFSILFLYFILQVKPWLDTIHGATPSRQTGGNFVKGNPLRSESPRARGVYGKIYAVYPTAAKTGIFHPSFFILLLPTRMPLTFSQQIYHGDDRLQTALPLPRHWPQCPPGLTIGTLKILDGRGFGMAQAIWAVERGFFDVMLLTKTEIQL